MSMSAWPMNKIKFSWGKQLLKAIKFEHDIAEYNMT